MQLSQVYRELHNSFINRSETNIIFMLNTDIVYLNGSRTHNKESIPDCFHSASPPKKVGRNREKDQLLLQLHFQNGDVGEDEVFIRGIRFVGFVGEKKNIPVLSNLPLNTIMALLVLLLQLLVQL